MGFFILVSDRGTTRPEADQVAATVKEKSCVKILLGINAPL
jgi:hypothetical protein